MSQFEILQRMYRYGLDTLTPDPLTLAPLPVGEGKGEGNSQTRTRPSIETN